MTAEMIRVRIDVFVKQISSSQHTLALLRQMAEDETRNRVRQIM